MANYAGRCPSRTMGPHRPMISSPPLRSTSNTALRPQHSSLCTAALAGLINILARLHTRRPLRSLRPGLSSPPATVRPPNRLPLATARPRLHSRGGRHRWARWQPWALGARAPSSSASSRVRAAVVSLRDRSAAARRPCSPSPAWSPSSATSGVRVAAASLASPLWPGCLDGETPAPRIRHSSP